MKLTTVILIVSLMQVSAASIAQKLTYVHKQASIVQIIKEIRKQTGYNVLVSTDNIKNIKPMDVNFQNTPLGDVLDQALKDQPLTYEIRDKTVIIKEKDPTILDKIKASLDVPITMTGHITDILGAPLIGATITIKGRNKVAITDEKGDFTIDGQPGDELVVTFIGYQPATFTIKTNTTYLNIVLHIASGNLSEVEGHKNKKAFDHNG